MLYKVKIMDYKTFDEVNRSATDFTVNGKCSNCGECCSAVLPISNRKLKRIKEYVRKHNIKPHLNVMINADIDITCPFRNEKEKKCDIYEVRPWVCQKFICSNAKVSSSNITKKTEANKSKKDI